MPAELIAQEPLQDRSGSRMLVLHRAEQRWEDREFRNLPEYLREEDCLVINNSKVFPSRLYGTRLQGTARLQVFLVEALTEDFRTWRALVRPGRKVTTGDRIRFSNALEADVVAWGEHGERTIHFGGDVDVLAEVQKIGHVPLPPYIHRSDTPQDRDRYQTTFARETGSVAAPTAGLHFTPEVLEQCRRAGAHIAEITLHVGLGTFAPLRSDEVEQNTLHAERYHVPCSELKQIRMARRRVAVGTTTVRALETVHSTGENAGTTNIFIYPGYSFQLVDSMVTNFHLPKSSLLMLVCAFAGREFTMSAYEHAVKEGYRFFSYGDCMLIL